MTDTLTPPFPPSVNGTTASAKARVLTAAYGDGYKTDAPDGANAVDRTMTLVWGPIAPTDVDTIIAFLEAHAGVPFYFLLPREQAPRTWVATTWDRTYPNPMDDGLTVQLEERFVY